MVDIHSHILPEVDDGARSWGIAQDMCRMAREDGITHMVATPHANDEYSYDRQWLESVLARLRELVGPELELTLGCDFHFSYDNIQKLLADPRQFTIGSTQYLLVEFSDFAIPPYIGNSLAELFSARLVPIITHPERNPLLQRNLNLVAEWADMGCVVQVTGSSLAGDWGERALKAAEWLLRRGLIHVLATDAHGAQRRKPVLSTGRDAAARLIGEEAARALVETNPAAIVAGKPLAFASRL